jgi:diguanylate cyclase (GGDEF)-like protein
MPGPAAATARLRAYALWEAVQGETHEASAAELVELEAASRRESWSQAAFVAAGALVVHAVVHRGPEVARPMADDLVTRAEALDAPALLGIAHALRSVAASLEEDTGAVLAHAGRAVVLAEDPTQDALDRCTAIVVCAAAYNSLSLWELGDELFGLATDLASDCEQPLQQPAVMMNRMLLGLEWSTALLELGDEAGALALLRRASGAAGAALALDLRPLWVRAALAGRDLVALVLDVLADDVAGDRVDDRLAVLDVHRAVLEAGHDVEVGPLMDAFAALCLVRLGRRDDALARLDHTGALSTSSGSRSFAAWVRAEAVSGDEADDVSVAAHREYGVAVSRARWAARRAVLAAARSTIAAQRLSDEHADLSRDVLLDPLTGLANRRRFDQWLADPPEQDQAEALMLIDLDDFKRVNDVHGHAVGDEALRRVARVVSQHVRPRDLAVRLGGDEFAVLLVEETGEQDAPDEVVAGLRATAVERGRAIREAVALTDWERIAPGLRVRLSVGVEAAVVGPGAPGATDRLYRLADADLYESKGVPNAAVG